MDGWMNERGMRAKKKKNKVTPSVRQNRKTRKKHHHKHEGANLCLEEEKIQNLMSTPSTAFVASIPSVTLSGTMQAVALRAEQLVKNHPEGAPFRGFCLLNLVPFLPQSLARQSLGKSTPPQKDDIALTDVMPCAYLCGMSLSEASVLAEIYTSSRFRTSPALFHVCEVPCLSHPTQKKGHLPRLCFFTCWKQHFDDERCCTHLLGGNQSFSQQFATTIALQCLSVERHLFLDRV